MAATAQIISGTIKFPVDPNRVKDFGNGPRVNIAIETSPDQPLIRIYGEPGDPLLTRYRKGQSVKVVAGPDGKGYKLLEEDTPPVNGPRTVIASEPHEPEHRKSPDERADEYADLYLRIWDRLGESLLVSDEIRHTATATVFIQVCRDGNR